MTETSNPYQPPSANLTDQTAAEDPPFPRAPLRTMWLRPRRTIRGLAFHRPTHLVARLLGGTATLSQTALAYAWSSLPQIAMILLVIPAVGIAATATGIQAGSMGMTMMLIMAVGAALLVLWTIVLWVASLAEVHNLTVWRALCSVVIPPGLVVLAAWLAVTA